MSAPRVTFDRVVLLRDGSQPTAHVVARVEMEVGAGHGYETHFEIEGCVDLDSGADLLFSLTAVALRDLERTAEHVFQAHCEGEITEADARGAAMKLRACARPESEVSA